MKLTSKGHALAISGFVYILALVIAVAVGWLTSGFHPLVMVLFADIAGTLTIFLFSRLFNNASLYDPYWSVAPVIIALFWLVGPYQAETITLRHMLVTLLVCAWSLRLTWNCIHRWRGMKHEDWRYRDLHTRSGKIFPLVDLFGIELMPTLVVFLACLSLYPVLTSTGNSFNGIDIAALIVTAAAISIEAMADRQMTVFLQKNRKPDSIMEEGLWAYSRHPNYFGEVLFWWGLFMFALATGTGNWWTITGPLAITCLFVFISIPMMERRNILRRPGYLARRGHVSPLIPWLPGSSDEEELIDGQNRP